MSTTTTPPTSPGDLAPSHLDRCDVSVPDPFTGLPRITLAPGLLTDDLGTPWAEETTRGGAISNALMLETDEIGTR